MTLDAERSPVCSSPTTSHPYVVRYARALALLLVLMAAFLPSTARADEGNDTVILANGGRLRGTVAEDDPIKGVTIKLVGGEVRKLPRKDVKEVKYASDAPPPAAAAVAAPVQPMYVLPPQYGAPPYGAFGGGYRPPMERRNGGLYAGGVVMSTIGSVAIGAGIFAAIVECHQSEKDAECRDSAAAIGAGAALLAGGLAMVIVGGKHVPAQAARWIPTQVYATNQRVALAWTF